MSHKIENNRSRVTAPEIFRRKRGEPVVMLTAYTARMASLLEGHCDALLVGDSLAQVVYGQPSTLQASLDQMIAHGAAVVRGSWRPLIVIDLPFASYEGGLSAAFDTAARVLAETGAGAVKLEGGTAMAPTIEFLTARGIPVMGHVGLTPQSVNTLGGYAARGRSNTDYARILDDARAVAQAGAFSIVVEAVVETLARTITEEVDCPTIGIGASAFCDGQVLVTEDMLGFFEKTARFVKRYDDLASRVDLAAKCFADDVHARRFPEAKHTYGQDSAQSLRDRHEPQPLGVTDTPPKASVE